MSRYTLHLVALRDTDLSPVPFCPVVSRIGIQVERIRFAQAEHGRQRNRVTIWRSWSSVMSLVTRTTTPLGYSISHNALPEAFLAE